MGNKTPFLLKYLNRNALHTLFILIRRMLSIQTFQKKSCIFILAVFMFQEVQNVDFYPSINVGKYLYISVANFQLIDHIVMIIMNFFAFNFIRIL